MAGSPRILGYLIDIDAVREPALVNEHSSLVAARTWNRPSVFSKSLTEGPPASIDGSDLLLSVLVNGRGCRSL